MTVCIAAIAQGAVIGASDRMLSSGDIAFEPGSVKVYGLSNSIQLMTAGDASVQDEVCWKVMADVGARIRKNPANWWKVNEVADLYSGYVKEVHQRQRELQVLAPLGLTFETFISRQHEMSSDFIASVTVQLRQVAVDSVCGIVTGIDDAPPLAHIYVVLDGEIRCEDKVGFAAIGSGARHALSEMMFAGHDPSRDLPSTVSLVYSAKKRAEAAPGVGESTDMFAIGPGKGTHLEVGREVLDHLESGHNKMLRRVASAARQAAKDLERFVRERAAAQQQVQEASSETAKGGPESKNQ